MGGVVRRAGFTCALTLAVMVSGCWMFSALGDFPVPDSGIVSGDAGRDSGHDAGRDARVDVQQTQDARKDGDTGTKSDAHAERDAAPDADASDGDDVIVPAFYVSTTGSDDNDAGTLTAPFATLARAQAAMEASTIIKTTYIRAGSYTLPSIASCAGSTTTCGLRLGASDYGETWSYYPPDGVDSADLSAGSTGGESGLVIAVEVAANSVRIDGLSIHDFQYAAVDSSGGADYLTVTNSLIYNGYSSGGGNPGGITCYGCTNMTISHNVIHDMAEFGLSLTSVNGNLTHLLVDGNVFYNTCTAIGNCGAVYLEDSSATATGLAVTNNYIHDGNTSAGTGDEYGSAIYAASCLSNMKASGNVITGKNGPNTILVQGGSNVHLSGNLTDFGDTQPNVAAFQTSSGTGCASGTMSGNEYEDNIVISAGGGGNFALLSGAPLGAPTIKNNDYYNYGGTAIGHGGAYADSNAVSQNPQLSGRTYTIDAGSPVLGPPVSFPPLIGGWGPPGYVLPTTGTTPSSPP
jgi:hypothetical protein